MRLVLALSVFLGSAAAQVLPPVPYPPGNPHTPQKAILGKIIFYEEQLSDDHTVACATCHMPEVGGGDPRTNLPASTHPGPDHVYGNADDIQGSISVVKCDPGGYFIPDPLFGFNPFIVKRKSPGFIGGQWDPLTFWDGRAPDAFVQEGTANVVLATGATLENQASLVPPSGTMGCQGRTWTLISQKLQTARPMRLATNIPADIQAALALSPTYPALFQAAFGDPAINRERAAMAMATYERSLVPDQTPYDAYVGGNNSALTAAQVNGLGVLVSHNCVWCHAPPLFTDHSFRNIGVRPPAEDVGFQIATGNPADRGKFKSPNLRNVSVRAPYFHNGRTATLNDVVLFYERGGDFADNKDPLMIPFTLSTQDRADLVDFMANGLLDPRVPQNLPPFDRPTLNSELAANPARYGTGSPGSGALVPRMICPIPPMIGTHRFALGVADAVGGAPAILALAFAPAPPNTFLGPHPLWIAPSPLPSFLPLPLGGAPGVPGAGYGSIVTPITDNPVYAGATFYAQWAVGDPNGALGLCVSDACSVTFFAP